MSSDFPVGQPNRCIKFETPFPKRAVTVGVGAVTAIALGILAYGALSMAGIGSLPFTASAATTGSGLVVSMIGGILTIKCFKAPIITQPNPVTAQPLAYPTSTPPQSSSPDESSDNPQTADDPTSTPLQSSSPDESSDNPQTADDPTSTPLQSSSPEESSDDPQTADDPISTPPQNSSPDESSGDDQLADPVSSPRSPSPLHGVNDDTSNQKVSQDIENIFVSFRECFVFHFAFTHMGTRWELKKLSYKSSKHLTECVSVGTANSLYNLKIEDGYLCIQNKYETDVVYDPQYFIEMLEAAATDKSVKRNIEIGKARMKLHQHMQHLAGISRPPPFF